MSLFERYSAVEIFGAPLDDHEVILGKTSKNLIDLVGQYDIEPQPLPEGLTDITPIYWRNPGFSYFLSYSEPAGVATIDMMPRADTSNATMVTAMGSAALFQPANARTIRIPKDQDFLPILGGSPRFPEHLCLHELIVYRGQ